MLLTEFEVPQFAREESHFVEGFPHLGLVSIGSIKTFLLDFPQIMMKAIHGVLEAFALGEFKVTFFFERENFRQ